MTQSSTQSGTVFSARPLGPELADAKHQTLIDTPNLKVKRMVLPAGKELPPHKAPGDITVHGLEGRIEFVCVDPTNGGKTHQLAPGDVIYLSAGELHSAKALADSSFLLTIFSRP